MLLKDALKGKDPDKTSLKSVESKDDEQRGTLKVDKKITLVKTESGWRFDYCGSPS